MGITKQNGLHKMPWWGRIVALLFAIIFSIGFTAFIIFGFFPPAFVVYGTFLSTLIIGATISFLPFKFLENAIYSAVGVLAIWSFICFTATPMLAKQYYLKSAVNILPAYSDARLIAIEYEPGGMDNEELVRYSYASDQADADYQKMYTLYKNQLASNGYIVYREVPGVSAEFHTGNDSLPDIFLNLSKQRSNEISVSLAF